MTITRSAGTRPDDRTGLAALGSRRSGADLRLAEGGEHGAGVEEAGAEDGEAADPDAEQSECHGVRPPSRAPAASPPKRRKGSGWRSPCRGPVEA